MDKPSGGSEEYWNQRYARMERIDWTPSEFLSGNIKLIPREGAALVLGCGTGKNAFFLAKQLKVVGVDISGEAIKIAKKCQDELDEPGDVKFETGDAIAYLESLNESKFGLITSLNFFEPALVSGMKKALKPGGTLFIQAFTINDERLKESHVKDVLVDETTFFEPKFFGSYWIIKHEIGHFVDGKGKKRERINLVARKPFL